MTSMSGRITNVDLGDTMDNKLSSLRIEPYDNRQHGAATVFSKYDCRGRTSSFEFTGLETKTKYFTKDLNDLGIEDESVSSVMVPRGYVVELYENDGQGGASKTIIGSEDGSGYMPCVNMGSFNDLTSSLVMRQIEQGSAKGYWEGYTATETHTFEFVVGIENSSGNEDVSDQKSTIEASMELGLEFYGV